MIAIRNASLGDAEALIDIYRYYVENTAISFETVTPSADGFRMRMKDIMSRYPYLVIERDGRIEGYSYAHAFVGREAYSRSCEMTIYLRSGSQRSGMGRMLYEAMEQELKKMGILNLYACIAQPDEEDEYLTNNSIDFHEHMGYKIVGTFRNCGRKFDRWYTMVWMEKIIGEHTDDPAPLKWYN